MKKITIAALLCGSFLATNAQTFTSIQLTTPQNPAGASLPLPTPVVNAIYKYPNAATGIDAYVKITGTTNDHNSVSTPSDYVGVRAIDNPASVNGGYNTAFQPVVSSSNTNNSGLWTQNTCGQNNVKISHSSDQNYLVHFRLYFKKAGTQIDTALNVKACFFDIDGFGAGTEAEQDAFMKGVSYSVSSGTTLNFTNRSDGLINAEGDPTNVAGLQLTATTSVAQVVYLYRTYVDFAFGMNTHTASTRNSCYDALAGGRLKGVSFDLPSHPTCPITVNTCVSLSGTVWDDANGSANNTFSNIYTAGETGTAGGGLYVYAIDVNNQNTIIGKSAVAANGTYTISNIPRESSVKLLLTNANYALGKSNVTAGGTINSGWVNTSPLVRASVAIGTSNVTGKDFGIERTPTSNSYTATIPTPVANSVRPLTSLFGLMPLSGNDPEDGALGATHTFVIMSTAGLNGNVLAYNGVALQAGDTVHVYNTSLLTIKFSGISSTSASFTFNFIDNAGFGGTTGTYTINWSAALPPVNPLPVKLSSFTATKSGNNALLSWSIGNQNKLALTEVERSANAIDWQTIGKVDTKGGSNEAEYQFTDANTIQGSNYYRLRFTETDNASEYSPVVNVLFAKSTSVSLYPNPVGSKLHITTTGAAGISGISILNQTGTVVFKSAKAVSEVDLSKLTPGSYNVIVYDSEGSASSFRIMKQ